MLLCLHGIHHQKESNTLDLVGIECGFILNIMAKYWEYNDGDVMMDIFIKPGYAVDSVIFPVVNPPCLKDVVWCHFEHPGDLKELLVAKHGLSFPHGYKILGKRPGRTWFDSQKNIAGGEFSRPCNKVNDGWKMLEPKFDLISGW